MFCRAIPYDGKEPYIFISYCHADKEMIYPLIEQMSLDGYRVWYDVGNQPGLNWLVNIEDHLENCKAVIAFISKHSSDSNNCNKEIVYAMKCQKKIIPVMIEEVSLPRGLRMQLVDLHYLERKNFPSNKALLQKCYESAECAECRNPAGSIPLRPIDAKKSANYPPQDPAGSPIGDLQLVDIKRTEKVSCEPPKEDVPADNPQMETDLSSNKNSNSPASAEGCIQVTTDTGRSEKELPDEPTVYCQDSEEETVIGRSVTEDDEDPTVRISRNLAILLRPATQTAYRLTSPKISIGRSQIRCDVAIPGNNSISKVHAIIRQTRQACYIEDANSSNGTYLHGDQIEPGKQILLDNPAVFQLNDETLILLSGTLARKYDNRSSVSLLINENATAIRIMEADTLPLNRNNKWADGTLSDGKIHRAGHALLSRRDNGVYLVDESPERGNGTHLNGIRLHNGEAKLLSSGDRIRLGDTYLEFVSIEIPS